MAINRVVGSIPYSVGVRIVNPGDAESDKKAYAYVQSREVVDNRMLAQHIKEHGSPFSIGTLNGVIDDICECIGEMILMGNRVYLNELGTFSISLLSEGVDNADSFTAANITEVKPHMSFDDRFVALLQNAEFEYVTSRKAQADAKKAEKQNVNHAMGTGGNTTDPNGGDNGGNNSGSGSGGSDDTGVTE